jgi:hypothetical protein
MHGVAELDETRADIGQSREVELILNFTESMFGPAKCYEKVNWEEYIHEGDEFHVSGDDYRKYRDE